MTTITLEDVIAEQLKLNTMIEQLRATDAPIIHVIAEQAIELQSGEHYAGTELDEAGQVKHHLVLMAARPGKRLSWQAAMDWAESIGGQLPTRQEQALLFANAKPHLDPEWHWSSQEHESEASYAWGCYFGNGTQGLSHKSYEGCAVAVRRV